MLGFSIKLFIIFFIVVFLFLAWYFYLGRRTFLYKREKSSSFECGFDGKDKSRVPFSLRFFFLLLVFLVFDVELTLLLQLPYVQGLFAWKGKLLYLALLWLLLLFILEEVRRGLLC